VEAESSDLGRLMSARGNRQLNHYHRPSLGRRRALRAVGLSSSCCLERRVRVTVTATMGISISKIAGGKIREISAYRRRGQTRK